MITNLRRLHPEVPESALTPRDLSAVLIATNANGDHVVDYERALSIAQANHELVFAAEDYDRHLKLIFEVKYQFKRQTKYGRKSTSEATRVVAEDLVVNGLVSAPHSVAYAGWLLEEGLRIQKIIDAEKAILVRAA